jgi:predicted DNA binding CopG/RHH family protein
MKTTLEIPDPLFRKAKSLAAEKGIPFRELVTEALAEKLRSAGSEARPWLKSFG